MSKIYSIRARLLDFKREPKFHDDWDSARYIEDGLVIVENGRIKSISAFGDVEVEGEITDYRPYLVMPGFIDLHLHMPQMQVIASYAAQLLDWLQDHTFPVESGFDDAEICDRISKQLVARLIDHGTTTAVAFCTSHPQSVESYFQAAKQRNMCVIGGKVMMDRGAPSALCDTPQRAYDETKVGIERWHGHDRIKYAITPRFAITSSPEQLGAARALIEEFSDCYVQTHLNENLKEIELTAALYPEADDYLGVYEQFGLLGSKTLLGHCIHMQPREIDLMVSTGAVAVHCPTSNLFIGSGLFDWRGLRKNGIRVGLATDIGGGTSYSMLRTQDEAYKIAQLRGDRLFPLLTAYTATRGNAEALGLVHEIGTLETQSFADFIVLNANATPEMALRYERVNDIRDELFLLQTLGDDRCVEHVYISGVRQTGSQ